MELHNQIVELLKSLPNIHNKSDRQALIFSATLDKELEEQIEFEGTTGQFCQSLVKTLGKYGTLKDGRPPFIALLEAAKNYVGQEGKERCNALIQQLQKPIQDKISQPPQGVQVDWGEAPDVSVFFGRTKELETLEQWILKDRCRLVAVLGIAGVGKTDLSAKLAVGIQEQFEFVIWKKLLNAPPLTEILLDLIKFLSSQQEIDLPNSEDAQISRLLHYFRAHRCLLVIDNMEAVLQGGDHPGKYREGYAGYGELLRQVGEIAHQSCIALTSREKPQEIAHLEGQKRPVRSLKLGGLNEEDGRKLFEEIGEFSGSDDDWKTLIEFYNGNPLALELAAKHIQEVFFGDIAVFLHQGKPVFRDIRDLLDWHFERLSDLEKEVMYWLAIDREPVSFTELNDDLVSLESQNQLSSTLQALQRRVPLERSLARFTLQPVLIEYLTRRLVKQIGTEITITKPEVIDYTTEHFVTLVSEEIKQGKFELLNRHALLKALAKDYVRESQIRLILQPLIERLLAILGSQAQLEVQLNLTIATLREQSPCTPGYAAGNILHILIHLQSDLGLFDFSHLSLRQVYLQGVCLHNVNLGYSDIVKGVFTQTFGAIMSVAFSPDGRFFAAGDTTGQIRLWRLSDCQHVLTLQGHTDRVQSVAFSPDGYQLVSRSADHTVKTWDACDGKCLATLQGHSNWVLSVAFSPDGRWFASGSADHTVKLWDIHGKFLATLQEDNTDLVRSVAFSPDGHQLASGSDDHKVRIWDVCDGKCLITLQGHTNRVQSVAFSPDGQHLASGSADQTVRIWDIRNGICLTTLRGHNNWVLSVAFSPDGQHLASGGDDHTVKLWDIHGKYLATLQGHTDLVQSVAFSPDGHQLASGSADHTVKTWDVCDGKCLITLQGHSNWVLSVAFSPDGQRLASGNEDRTVRIWDVLDGKCLATLQGHTNRVRSVAFSPDGFQVASGSTDQTVRIWDIRNGICLTTLRGHSNWVRSVAFSPDGQHLASGGDDQTVKIWNVREEKCLTTLEEHSNRIVSVAFSPDGLRLASGSDDHTVRIWDVQNGKCIAILRGHTDLVQSVTFSPDGHQLASGSADQTIRIWDVPEGKYLTTLEGHSNWIISVAFSPDGLRLASGSDDHTVKVWDVQNEKCLATLQGHTHRVQSVAFSPDGYLLASGSDDGKINLWSVHGGECLKTLRPPRPYEGTNITGVTGLTEAQKVTLKALGAVEK